MTVDFKKMYEQCEDENIRLTQLVGHLKQENVRLRAYPSFVNGERIAELEEAALEALHAWEEDETQQMIYSAMKKLRKAVNREGT